MPATLKMLTLGDYYHYDAYLLLLETVVVSGEVPDLEQILFHITVLEDTDLPGIEGGNRIKSAKLGLNELYGHMNGRRHHGYISIPLFNLDRVLNEGTCLQFQFLATNTNIPLCKFYVYSEDGGHVSYH